MDSLGDPTASNLPGEALKRKQGASIPCKDIFQALDSTLSEPQEETGAEEELKRKAFELCNSNSRDAATLLLNYYSQKKMEAKRVWELLSKDEELQKALLEASGITSYAMGLDDFHYLFGFHEDPHIPAHLMTENLLENMPEEAVKKRSKSHSVSGQRSLLLAFLGECTRRMFSVIQNERPELGQAVADHGITHASVIRLLNGFHVRNYGSPSFLTFRQRYEAHTWYLEESQTRKICAKDVETYFGENGIKQQVKRSRTALLSDPSQGVNKAVVATPETSKAVSSAEHSDESDETSPLLSWAGGAGSNSPSAAVVESLSRHFSRCYLDRPVRAGDDDQLPAPQNPVPIEYEEGVFSHVAHFENAISEDEYLDIEFDLGRSHAVPWIKVPGEGGGRAGSMMRVAFREDVVYTDSAGAEHRAVFLSGNEDTGKVNVYAGMKATRTEIKIMKMFEDLLCPFLREFYGHDFPFAVNNLVHVIGPPFGNHNDCDKTHTTTGDGDEYRMPGYDDLRLPTWDEAITATICLESRKGGHPVYHIRWRRNGEELKTVRVGPRAIHIQLPGCNSANMTHEVGIEPEDQASLGPLDWRWVISARCTVVPTRDNIDAFLAHFPESARRKIDKGEIIGLSVNDLVCCPLDILEEKESAAFSFLPLAETAYGTCLAEPAGTAGTGSKRRKKNPNLDLHMHSGRYRQCSADVYHDLVKTTFLVQLVKRLEVGQRQRELYCNYRVMQKMLDLGLISRVVSGQEGKKLTEHWPLFGFQTNGYRHYPVKHRLYKEASMRSNAKIVWRGGNANTPINCSIRDKKFWLFPYTVFYAHRHYKQDYESLVLYMFGLLRWVKMIGSGGSPKSAGEGSCETKSSGTPEEAAHGHTAHPQTSNQMNKTLDQASLIRKVVAIFLSHDVCVEIVKIIESLTSIGPVTYWEHKTYFEGPGKLEETGVPRGAISSLLPADLWHSLLSCKKDDCLFLSYFVATSNNLDGPWPVEKIRQIYARLPQDETKGYEIFRDDIHRAPVYEEVDEGFHEKLPHLDESGRHLVGPEKPLRVVTVDIEREDRASCLTSAKRNEFIECLKGETFRSKEEILNKHLDELANDTTLPTLNEGGALVDLPEGKWMDVDEEALNLNWERKPNDRIKLTPRQLWMAMLSLSAAGALRACKECLRTEQQIDGSLLTCAIPLLQLELGTSLRMFPNPMPSRASDNVPLLMRKVALEHHKPADGEASWQRASLPGNVPDQLFIDQVFQCVLACVTGNPAAIGMYINEAKPARILPVPEKEEVDSYLAHIKATLDNGSKWCNHMHQQFHESIPQKIRSSYSEYASFVRSLSSRFHTKFSEVWQKSKNDSGGVDRKQLIGNFSKMLQRHCEGTPEDHWWFFSGQVVASMDELYTGEPLGEATMDNVPVGYGAYVGAKHLKHFGTPKPRPGNKKKRRKESGEGGSTKSSKKGKKLASYVFLSDVMTPEMGQHIFAHMKQLTTEELTVLLWYRDNRGTIRSRINGRPFGWTDVEHMLVSPCFFVCFFVCPATVFSPTE